VSDLVLEYMKKHDIPVTRENYVSLNTLGDADGGQLLEGENEAELPEDLQLQAETPEEKPNLKAAALNALAGKD
jgi:hypothetical protein